MIRLEYRPMSLIWILRTKMINQMWVSFSNRNKHLSVLLSCVHAIFMCLSSNFSWRNVSSMADRVQQTGLWTQNTFQVVSA